MYTNLVCRSLDRKPLWDLTKGTTPRKPEFSASYSNFGLSPLGKGQMGSIYTGKGVGEMQKKCIHT